MKSPPWVLLCTFCCIVSGCKNTRAPQEVDTHEQTPSRVTQVLTLQTEDCSERPVVLFGADAKTVDLIAKGRLDSELWKRFILEQKSFEAAPLCQREIPLEDEHESYIVFAPKESIWDAFFRSEDGAHWGVSNPGERMVRLEMIVAKEQERRCVQKGLMPWDEGPIPLCVDLPEDYATGERRYPVVWLLPGYSGDDTVRFQELQDATQDAILIGVDSRHEHGTSYFEDAETSGSWQSMLNQSRALVDASFRTTGAHGVLGKSTGGFNAVSLALRDTSWRCAAAIAPDGLDLKAWLIEDGVVAPMWLAWTRMEATVGGPGQMTSYAHAWSAGHYPYSLETGEPDDRIGEWLEHSPIEMLDAHSAGFEDKLFLASAERDEFDLHPHAEAFHEALEARRITHTWRPFDGTHFTIPESIYMEGLNYCIQRLASAP